jgi:hypothetical protein
VTAPPDVSPAENVQRRPGNWPTHALASPVLVRHSAWFLWFNQTPAFSAPSIKPVAPHHRSVVNEVFHMSVIFLTCTD